MSGISAIAATPKPSVKPSVNPSVKAHLKAHVKAPVKVSVKPVPKKIVKAPVKKKVAVRKVRKKIPVTPSPAPSWPLKGFSVSGEVLAKIPTSRELVGIISATKTLAAQVKDCGKFVCAAVQVASENGCTWWEVTARVVGVTSESDKTLMTFGSVRTTIGSSLERELKTILIVSMESLDTRRSISPGIDVLCHHDPAEEKVPSTIYTPTN